MSVVRLTANYYSISEEYKERAKEIWPELEKSDGFTSMPDKIVEMDDVPEWVGECPGITIKPLHQLRFRPQLPDLNKVDSMDKVSEFVKTVNQVVLPGFELLQYQSIFVENNCCTETIQSYMGDGWRILAVIPQSDQRRPDYIMVHKEAGKE